MNSISEIYKFNGFKLISLDLRENSLTGKSKLHYNFIDPDDKQDIIYTTVVIGPNGTGKSNLFRIIIELLKELNDLSRGKNRTYNVDGLFCLKFSVNGDIFEYANFYDDEGFFKDIPNPEKGIKPFLLKNGSNINIELKEVQLPISIVANSIMLTDKFPFYRKENNDKGEIVEAFPRYKYLGVRNIPQSASTRAYVRRTVEFIVEQFEKKGSNKNGFLDALKRATNFLELENSIGIFYYTSNNAKFFKGNLTPKDLNDYFESIHKNYPTPESNPPFKLNQYLKIKNNVALLKSICDFCNQLVNKDKLEKLPYKYSSIRKITYNLIEPQLFEQLNEDYTMLEQLRQLGMISSPEIQLKRNDGYSLQESSSGEYHFFSSIVGLMATVIPTNSLVLIDEPEISLHPNWQMKYLSFLRELFCHPEYATCHILVATHSHFLISDLKGGNSKIIGLKRNDGKIEIVDLPKSINTFGWSAEDVLYNIFNVRSSLNYYLEADLTELLGMIANNIKDKKKITQILEKLNMLPKRANDPLQEIIAEATEYLNSME
ncbi:MAG: AAA family ATPase [Flavobacteriales bacterium]|nr:MAG: AAA family ATPase [Flavobacteriales bacterium]